MLADELGDAIEHVAGLLERRHRFQLAVGELEREVEVALVAGVDDGGERTVTDEQARDRLDRAAAWPTARPGSVVGRRVPRGARA